MPDDKKDTNEDKQKDFHQRLSQLEHYLSESDPDKDTLKDQLRREGISVFADPDEAKEYKRKMLERQRQRIEKRKRLQKDKNTGEDYPSD